MSAGAVTKSAPVLVVGPPGGDDAVVYLTSSFDRIVPPIGVTALLLFDRPIPEPAETIRAALSRALAHYLLAPGGTTTEQRAVALTYSTLVVSSWRNLGFEAADFGGGRPARVTWHWHGEETTVPSCVVCPPGTDGDNGGVSVTSLFVRPEHADAFLAELAAMSPASIPSPSPSP